VFSADGRYLGQYSLSPPPYYEFVIEGTKVNASASGKFVGALNFHDGPPGFEEVDGYHGEFFR